MLVSLPRLLGAALDGGYAVGYFEAWDSYSLEAVVAAAEAESSPVILGIGCMMTEPAWMENGGIAALGLTGLSYAARSAVPVSFILNEARSWEQIDCGLHAGFNAVMLDTSHWPHEEAVAAATRLVDLAHRRAVAVEAEVGALPDAVNDGIDDRQALLTDPELAATFVERTGVDALAVSVGNVHLLSHRTATIDLDRLAAIHERTAVPLVMHGGTGYPPDAVGAAIKRGVAKFNVGTVLKEEFLRELSQVTAALPEVSSVHELVGSHREKDVLGLAAKAMATKIRALMQLYGSSGQANEKARAGRASAPLKRSRELG